MQLYVYNCTHCVRRGYKKYLNKLTHIKNVSEQHYYQNLLSNCKSSSKTWSTINEIIDFKNSSNKSKLPHSIVIEGERVKTDSPKFREKLCEYFANIGTIMSKNLPFSKGASFKIHHSSCVQSFMLEKILSEDVNDCIDKLKSYTAPGLDQISPKFVKLSKCVLAPLLARLFNRCIELETFPNDFKVASVIPIPKKISPTSLDEFRPISLLSVFSKLFEKILESKMTKFITKNCILTPSQFDFTENNSTELAITTFYDKLLNNLNGKLITCSIFLDLRKAFDSVSHEILLKKLYHYGFRGKMFNLLSSYLSGRQICTKINDKLSSLRPVKYGVPQGSVLGPLLFLLYVNDLPNVSKFETTLFADDTTLHLAHHDFNILQQQVKEETDKIENWVTSNKLTINYNKSCYMIISGNKKKIDTNEFNVSISGNVIVKSDYVKYLGVFLDDRLSWKIHINKLSKKLSRACGMVYKLRHYVPLSSLKLVYYGLFHSHLQYSLLNWGRAASSHLQKLIILQNKFIRASLFCAKEKPINFLYSKFNTLMLTDMINIEFAKFMFKYNNRLLPPSFNNYFTKLDVIHHYNTRQKGTSEFFQPFIASETGKKSLQYIGLKIWKNIPEEFKYCSFSSFKKYVKSSAVSKYV